METTTPTDPAEASFDIVARQDKTEAEVGSLRSDVDEVIFVTLGPISLTKLVFAVDELPKPYMPAWKGLDLKAVAHTIILVVVLSLVLTESILPQVTPIS